MANNLIYTRRPDAQELSMEEVQRLAPAVFTEDKDPALSARYGAINTLQAIEIMRGYGFVPVQAAQKKSNKGRDPRHNQHLVAFAHKWNLLDRDRPEIIGYNSHDGKTSFRLLAGFFRGICSNGLIAGDGFEYRVRHHVATVSNFEDMVEDVANKLPQLSDNINRMKAVKLTSAEVIDFSYNAAALRWEMLPSDEYEENVTSGETRGIYANENTAFGLSRVRRWGDDNPDLWTVYNRVQEGLIRGGADLISFTDRNQYGKYRKARPVNSIADSVRINQSLWDMAVAKMEEA